MQMPIKLIPQSFVDKYHLQFKSRWLVYMEIRKVMYGLTQAGILANQLLKKRLAKNGYFKEPHMPGIWKHNLQLNLFTQLFKTLVLTMSTIMMQSNY
ncbi:hypothetical protein ACHAXS_000445 [Conticribra weissflogii]